MSSTVDLRKLLESWPYDPERDARLVRGEDGREILQVRTPLGIEQMEVDGRPDGERPRGSESYLEYHQRRLDRARLAGKEEPDFSLNPDDCLQLFNEGTLYYFRYIRFFQLKDWRRTVRDTARNLRVFDLVRRYAVREEDQLFLEKWRPYVVRINATASAMQAIDSQGHDKALRFLTDALSQIEALPELEDETFKFERDRSLAALRDMIGQVTRDRPLSRIELLERQLRRAIDRQEFERAAVLRDQIRALKAEPETKPGAAPDNPQP